MPRSLATAPLLAAALGLAVLFGGCSRKARTWPADLHPISAAGVTSSVRDSKGHTVLLVLFAGWCGDCRTEIPELVRALEGFRTADLKVVAVDLDEEPEAYRPFGAALAPVRLHPFDDDALVKSVEALGGHYHKSIPYAAVFDRTGALVRDRWAEAGRVRDIQETLAATLKRP